MTDDFLRRAIVSLALPEHEFTECSAVAPALVLSLEFEQTAADYRRRVDCVRAP